MSAAVLVAGVGNVFLGDDGFGVEVARRLATERLPPEVEVADFGVRGLHLAYRLLDPLRLVVVADLVSRGGPPGTLYVIEPLVELDPAANAPAEAHGLSLPGVLAAVAALGGTVPPVRVVGCEPSYLGEQMGLSTPVLAAISSAVRIVREMVEGALRNANGGAAEGGALPQGREAPAAQAAGAEQGPCEQGWGPGELCSTGRGGTPRCE